MYVETTSYNKGVRYSIVLRQREPATRTLRIEVDIRQLSDRPPEMVRAPDDPHRDQQLPWAGTYH